MQEGRTMTAFERRSGAYYRPSFFGGFSFFPPVIKILLVTNVAVWLLLDVLLPPVMPRYADLLLRYFSLWPAGPNFFLWQLFTYMFLHGGFWHLFFNMLALWMFGMELENTWGSKKFLIFYLICGLGAGLTNMLVAPLIGQIWPTVGASGAVFGVLVAFGMFYPDRPIYIYFLLPIKAKYFIAFYIAMQVFYEVTGMEAGVAHFAHLGGAAVGFVYVLADMNLIPLRRWWSILRPTVIPSSGRRERWRGEEIHDAKFYDIQTGKPKDEEQETSQEVIDAILDKISKGGYQSLSEEEKRILNEASKKIH